MRFNFETYKKNNYKDVIYSFKSNCFINNNRSIFY